MVPFTMSPWCPRPESDWTAWFRKPGGRSAAGDMRARRWIRTTVSVEPDLQSGAIDHSAILAGRTTGLEPANYQIHSLAPRPLWFRPQYPVKEPNLPPPWCEHGALSAELTGLACARQDSNLCPSRP